MKPSLVIFLHSENYDRVYQAVSLSLAASSMGWSCHLFLFFQALAGYVGGSWDTPRADDCGAGARSDGTPGSGTPRSLERLFEDASLPPAGEMLRKAREADGGVKLYACSASVKVLGLDPDEVRRRVDEIVGIPTMLRIAETAKFAWYI